MTERSVIQIIIELVELLHCSNIQSYLVYEPVLVHYGTRRVISDWYICVPDESLALAAQLVHDCSVSLKPVAHTSTPRIDSLEHLYTRYEMLSPSMNIIVVPEKACNMSCGADDIEISSQGIPYPKLSVYAQSLLDSLNRVDLADLVDGMNLTQEWGERNLDLDGHVDAQWGRWKADQKHGGLASPNQIPKWCSDPPLRRDEWTDLVAKKTVRRGWKAEASDVTRFRKRSDDFFRRNNPFDH